MKYIIQILLLFSLSGCLPDKENAAVKTVVQEVKKMIDQNLFETQYVIVYEWAATDLGNIFWITLSQVPIAVGPLEPPYKIIEYQDKYICLASPFNPTVIPKKELFEICHLPLDCDYGSGYYNKMWFIGVSADGKRHSIIETNQELLSYRPYIYPQLWQYLFKGYNEKNPPRFIFGEYSLMADGKYQDSDSIEKHIQQLSTGMVYYTNPKDSLFVKVGEYNSDHFFATINGKDTLKYIVTDTLMQHFWIESMPNPSFFQHLSSSDTWEGIQRLLCDSTFYFVQKEGQYIKEAVPVYMDFMINIKDSHNYTIRTLFKKEVSERWNSKIDSFTEWNSCKAAADGRGVCDAE